MEPRSRLQEALEARPEHYGQMDNFSISIVLLPLKIHNKHSFEVSFNYLKGPDVCKGAVICLGKGQSCQDKNSVDLLLCMFAPRL